MTRNWGIPPKGGFQRVRHAKPVLTLTVTAIYGIIGAALAAISFTDARSILTGLFRGFSLAPAIVAAGFGCWMYIYVAWPRFAAQFHGGDTFSDLIRFYARAAVALILFLFVARFARLVLGDTVSGLLLCVSGGAAAAAAFQTVMAFVPPGSSNEGAPKT
ncbi:MAG TPA: hypothetical protein PKM48_02620 [Parvularculaceae bacterium]|nr:hypothetical protein [Parvularculaceae bacterium]HNS87665.1 hypothetical protein [Parvularculaceae bacterium]